MTKLSEHFHSDEFSCPCCGKNKVAGELVAKLQELRDKVGEPIYITSGYRCIQYNKSVGGYNRSPHLLGNAADIQVKKIPACAKIPRYTIISKWLLYVILATIANDINNIRIGIYPNHLHIDIMPPSPSKFWLVKKYGGKYIYSKHEKDLAKFLKDNL